MFMTSNQETFTVWMKSLIFHSTGCTVYDSDGRIIYRVDNYNHRCRDEVFLMDGGGNLVLTVIRKKFRFFGCWEGYKCNDSEPWFVVRKPCKMMKRDSSCEVTVRWATDQSNHYLIEGFAGKSDCRIIDKSAQLIAEVKQKLSTSGVVLGDDVLSLVVEPNIDHSLIIGLMVVYGLMNHFM